MVCYSCEQKTQVINSRHLSKGNKVWRRRLCTKCQNIFTTVENIIYKDIIVIKSNKGNINKFSQDKLFLSILSSMSHRKSAVDDAASITSTIINKIVKNGIINPIETSYIRENALIALNRFDKVAATYYSAH